MNYVKYSLEALCLLSLCLPLLWEKRDDKKGDFDKAFDVLKRGFIAAMASLFVWSLSYVGAIIRYHSFGDALFLSLAIHFMFFDYWIAFELGHKKDWFSYLGKAGYVDNIPFWRNMAPAGKLATRMTILTSALLIYFS